MATLRPLTSLRCCFPISTLRAGLCLILILLAESSLAAEVYKWVDKNGQVHYSQIPPDKSLVKDEGDITVKSSNDVSIPVNRQGDYAYCGELKLPGPLYEPKRIMMGLANDIKNWERALQQTQDSLNAQLRALGNRNLQSNSRYSPDRQDLESDRRRDTARKIKEYQCALAWAEKQKEDNADIRDEIAHDLKGAKLNYQATLDKAHKDCGYEPRDFSNPEYNDKKSAWAKCMRPHERDIRASENTLNNLRRQAGNLQ